jgi:hypothetical protein
MKRMIKLLESRIDPDAIEAIFPDPGLMVQGIKIEEGNPNRSLMVLRSGEKVRLPWSVEEALDVIASADHDEEEAEEITRETETA